MKLIEKLEISDELFYKTMKTRVEYLYECDYSIDGLSSIN